MRVGEVLSIAVSFLGLAEEIEVVSADNGIYDDRLRRLSVSLDMVLKELACEFLSLRKNEKIIVADGRISAESFSRCPIKILSIKKDGIKQAHSMYLGGVEVLVAGEVVIDYIYLPNKVALLLDVVECDSRVSANLIALGVCSNYYLTELRYEEHTIFEKKFLNGLKNIMKTRADVTLENKSKF